MTGRCSLPLLSGTIAREPEFHRITDGRGLVTVDGWKIRYQKTADIYQLYYLPDDYSEANNLADRHPEKVKKLKELLLSECGGETFPKEPRIERFTY
jgi:hypothetical protein